MKDQSTRMRGRKHFFHPQAEVLPSFDVLLIVKLGLLGSAAKNARRLVSIKVWGYRAASDDPSKEGDRGR